MVSSSQSIALALAAGAFALAGCSASPASSQNETIESGVDGTCAQMYSMLTTEVLASQTLPKEQIDTWAQQAKASAAAAREGNGDKANELCQQTVDEMKAAGINP